MSVDAPLVAWCPVCRKAHRTPHALADQVMQWSSAEHPTYRIISALEAKPEGLTIDELVSVAYAHRPDGGPLSAQGTIRVLISKLRKRLSEYGYTIPLRCGGRGTRYQLTRVEAS